nr:hypothetical protein [Planctomycetota bacterium]
MRLHSQHSLHCLHSLQCAIILLTSASLARADEFLNAIAAAPVIDEVNLALGDPGHRFVQSPAGCSTVQTVAGVAARVIPPTTSYGYVAVRLGESKGLIAGATYVLEVDVVEDQPRSFFLLNRGDDTARGIACGASLPDSMYQYTDCNPEVLDTPLANGVRTWRSVFTLNERSFDLDSPRNPAWRPLTPANGFRVVIAQPERRRFVGSAGAAVSAIRLRKIADPATLRLTINRPPKELGWRQAFWREEMADGAMSPADNQQRAFANRIDWYAAKIRLMKTLGLSAFGKDLLEFGHNQGWDSATTYGYDWVNVSGYSTLWGDLLTLAGQQGVALLPYYEYAGSVGKTGLGPQRRAKPLRFDPANAAATQDYTQVSWSEINNADLTDPDTRVDFAKMLDCTIRQQLGKAEILGVWLRPRPAQMPVSFSDATMARFAAGTGNTWVTRERLRSDATLRGQYLAWWNLQRRAFLVDVRDRLRGYGLSAAQVLFTVAADESSPALTGDPIVAESNPDRWRALINSPEHNRWRPVMTLAEATADTRYYNRVTGPTPNMGGWEWQHGVPAPDPANYASLDAIAMTYPYNRRYTVSVASGMNAFRTTNGLAMIRHFPLNEDTIPAASGLGYACADMELAGPSCVLNDVIAVANGDPRWLGMLTGRSLATGYPQHVRAFYAAFLALPARPSQRLSGATTAPGVVVRSIDGGAHGTWLAIANTTTAAANAITITMPVAGTVTDCANGAVLPSNGTSLVISLAPASLRA